MSTTVVGRVHQQLLPVRMPWYSQAASGSCRFFLSLTFGKKRFKQISTGIPGLTPKCFPKIKELEVNGLSGTACYDPCL